MNGSNKRVWSSLLGFMALAVLAGALGIVQPQPDRAVVEVSRFGSVVRLLPDRLAFGGGKFYFDGFMLA